MQVIEPRTYSLPVLPGARVTVLGAGDVTKSLLISTALLRPDLPIRVIARTARSAELVRLFLNDLPRIAVEVLETPHVPDLSNELVVLAIGERTARYSKRSKKESLYAKNEALVAKLLPQLRNSVAIVVTNPSTAITRYLVQNGVQAYGIGVANDQLRFSNQTDAVTPNHYLVGAHNFHELVLGSRHSKLPSRFDFSHQDYKDILQRQDTKRFSRANLPYSVLDFDWPELEKANASLPPEYRWYARQRIHSKFHRTAMSCSLAVLNTVCFLTRRQPLYNNFSLEMPVYLPGQDCDTVLGWPIDGASMRPLEVTFDAGDYEKLVGLAQRYRLRTNTEAGPNFYLHTPFGDRVSITGRPSSVHEFFRTRLAHLFSIGTTPGRSDQHIATITIEESRKSLDEVAAGSSDSSWTVIPQHRGKNPQEHTDIRVLSLGTRRVVRFPHDDAIAVIDDPKRTVSIYCASEDVLFHELRRLVRDEIGVPSIISRGARILHAGLVSFKGVNLLVVGPSGGGKTTAVLGLLSNDRTSGYGAAERTMVWVAGSRMLALGVPESVTVYPGTLRQIPEFAMLAQTTPPEELWRAGHKTRLQLHDIVDRSGAAAIQREVAIDIIVEVNYDASVTAAVSSQIVDQEGRRKVLLRNDLTENDPVRLPWLGWIPKSYSREVYAFAESPSAVDMHVLHWQDYEALRSALIDIIARKKLYEETLSQPRVRV